MDNKKESKLLRQLKNMQRITLPKKEEGYTIPEIVSLIDKHLNLRIYGNTPAKKVIARKIEREFKRNKIEPAQVSSPRKRYYKTSDCNNMLNRDRLYRFLLEKLHESREPLNEYEKYEKEAQKIADSITGRKPQQRPTPEPSSMAERRQQVERNDANIAFHIKSKNQEKQEEGLNIAYEAAFREAKQRCLLDALSRLISVPLETGFKLDEEKLGQDVWNAFVMEEPFPASYDLAASKRLEEPSNYYDVSIVEALGKRLKSIW